MNTTNWTPAKLQSYLLMGLLMFFVAHITLLSPSGLEEDLSDTRSILPSEVLGFFQNEGSTLAPAVPHKIPPNYAIRDLEYLSTDQAGQRWRMLARKSFSYEASHLMHARDCTFFGKDGVVQAKEALFSETSNIVELFGSVVATMNDGTVILSEYAKVMTAGDTHVLIPMTEPVTGHRPLSKTSSFRFESMGLDYQAKEKELKLLSQVHMHILTDRPTHIDADYTIYRETKREVESLMMMSRPLEQQFVKAKQKDLDLKSRRLLTTLEENQTLQRMDAIGEVEFWDRSDPLHPARGTGGRAQYFEKQNVIFLTDYPQMYQDSDTITGDVIKYDRIHDTIEVDQSNAFNRK